MPPQTWAPGETVPMNRWTFGQYNRLLPVKATCRGLARLLLDEPSGISIQFAPHHLAAEATALGDYLATLDEIRRHTRDEKLATAFPTKSTNVAKSQARFANQFVAIPTKSGLSGLPVNLKLINHTRESKSHLQLTQAGWRFALLKNPILDQGRKTHAARFSDEEKEFLLRHVTQSVPVEDFTYRAVLRAMLGGANTPGTADSALRQFIPQADLDRPTPAFLASQRSGAISRMTDLGLIKRQRSGVRVTYEVTTTGRQYVAGI